MLQRLPLLAPSLIQSSSDPRKERSFSEWISNFLEEPHPYYHSRDSDDDLAEPLATDSMPGNDAYYDEIDDSVTESLIIIALAGALAFLLYYRQQRQTNHRREAERQVQVGQAGELQPPPVGAPEQPLPGQQPDGGFFPPRGDPNFAQWVAGGVGH